MFLHKKQYHLTKLYEVMSSLIDGQSIEKNLNLATSFNFKFTQIVHFLLYLNIFQLVKNSFLLVYLIERSGF